jgi:DNA-binding response OmpR family regulator
MKLLLVEDDPMMGASLQAALNNAGFEVHWFTDGAEAFAAISKAFYRAVVLDITLPGMDGLSLLTQLRASGSSLPVLMLTARDTTRDKVQCFESGADDFLVKTTDMEELIARLRALIRRAGYVGRLSVGTLMIDTDTHVASHNGEHLNLSNREFELLQALMVNAGKIVPRHQLEETVLGPGRSGESNAIEVHIHHLRQKIGEAKLKTVRGVGYVLTHP